MNDMQSAILVRTTSGTTVVVAPFSGEDAADEWIAEMRRDPKGYLGVTSGAALSFEVLPLQSPHLIPRKNPAQEELPLKVS